MESKQSHEASAVGHAELHDLIASSLEEQDGTLNLVVPLKTTTTNVTPVVALPGIEGTCMLMKPLAAELNSTVLCCQYSMEEQSSVDEITEALIEVSFFVGFCGRL